jgi:hypothetical protein
VGILHVILYFAGVSRHGILLWDRNSSSKYNFSLVTNNISRNLIMKRYRLMFIKELKHFDVKWLISAWILWKLLPESELLLDRKDKKVLRKRVTFPSYDTFF